MEKASVFTFMEEATCSFSEANLLGKGGFGLVHKGTLHSNSAHFRSWNSYSLQRFQVHNCPSNRKLRSKGKRLMWLPELLAHSATEYTSASRTYSMQVVGWSMFQVGHNILHDRKKLRKVIDPEMAPSPYTIESITMFSSLASRPC
ncbi:hypothetical protein V6N13_107990 [Hibiscus sabdariffa]|uniref:Uncharacterized protein n=1 Tax=Hibiscus sabdariffa TaxID=183260 RepID=A0ABR2SR93_9ROSI